ncbi:MAG: hypothetical protein ACOYNO_01995 [Saprospiraceae bacterium]
MRVFLVVLNGILKYFLHGRHIAMWISSVYEPDNHPIWQYTFQYIFCLLQHNVSSLPGTIR